MGTYFASEEVCFRSEADCHLVQSQQQETRSFSADHNGGILGFFVSLSATFFDTVGYAMLGWDSWATVLQARWCEVFVYWFATIPMAGICGLVCVHQFQTYRRRYFSYSFCD